MKRLEARGSRLKANTPFAFASSFELRASSLLLLMTPLFFLSFLTHAYSKTTSIRGKITNGTTGKAGQANEVRLIELKSGMKMISIVRNITGDYQFENIDLDLEIPHLIQASYEGVLYSSPLLPNQSIDTPIETTVYEATQDAKNIHLSRSHWIFEKDHDLLKIKKIFILKNESEIPKTYADPEGTFRFYVPPQTREPASVSVSTGSMPLRQKATQIENSNDYTIDYPIKPGQTEVMIEYAVDNSSGRISFEEKSFYDIPEIDLLLYPTDMVAQAEAFYDQGVQSKMDVRLLTGGPFQKGNVIALTLSGGTESVEPQVITVPHETQQLLIPLCLGLGFMLLLGSLPRLKQQKIIALSQKEGLILAFQDLTAAYREGRVSEKIYQDKKNRLKSQLLHLIKQS
ncbi:MAG: hypothetical protein HYS07_00205 [Chlamydiae bacterium]|nr:hypothetical protein [Chlamydiota bacterium]MBI3276329.1 hypothetical protein [Chlamydiota bacterium]